MRFYNPKRRLLALSLKDGSSTIFPPKMWTEIADHLCGSSMLMNAVKKNNLLKEKDLSSLVPVEISEEINLPVEIKEEIIPTVEEIKVEQISEFPEIGDNTKKRRKIKE